jgi:hypothetical protein
MTQLDARLTLPLVDPSTFAEAMKTHLTKLRPTSCWDHPDFPVVWSRLAETFNRLASGDAPGKVLVFPAPLGSGKSEGARLYCSKLPEWTPWDDSAPATAPRHPGVLIVVEMKKSADKMAFDINELADRTIAVTYHGDVAGERPLHTLAEYPVLIITHSALEKAGARITAGHGDRSNWRYFTAFGPQVPVTFGGEETRAFTTRKLYVIDEGPDLLQEARITLQTARLIRDVIPTNIATECPQQVQALSYVIRHFERMIQKHRQQHGEKTPFKTTLVQDGSAVHTADRDLTMQPLIAALPRIPASTVGAPMQNTPARAEWETYVAAVLRDVPSLLRQWHWMEQNGVHFTLHSSRSLVPPDLLENGFAILDGTAKEDMRYDMLRGCVEIIDVPSPRQYRNVRLVLGIVGKGMGKRATSERALQDAPHFLSRMQDAMKRLTQATFPVAFSPLSKNPKDRSVFILTNKDAQEWFDTPVDAQAQKGNFKLCQTAHYGETGGSNAWSDYDTCGVFGLQFPPRERAINVANAKTVRPEMFKSLPAVRQRGDIAHITTVLLQGFGRVRLRNVINAEGDCPETELYLLVSAVDDGISEEVVKRIKANMPGLRCVIWDYSEDSMAEFAQTPADQFLEAVKILKQQASEQGKNTFHGPALWSRLKLSDKQRENRIKNLRRPGHRLNEGMTKLGVTYTPSQRFRPDTDYFTWINHEAEEIV